MAKKKVENKDLSDLKLAVEQFKKVIKILDETFLSDLSSQSTLNKLVFSLFVANQEKIKDNPNFKIKIELQNENKKNFLEALKSLIYENINTINKFIQEYEKRPDDKIETDKYLKVIEIMKNSEKVNIKYYQNIEIYMEEFGFETFEILVIRKETHLLSNLIVFAIGILEICAGTALFYLSKNPKVLELAKFLVTEGFNDVIESVKATLKGEEINLKEFATNKGLKILAFSVYLLTSGDTSQIDLKSTFLDISKNKVFSHLKEYGTSWAASKLMNMINEKFSEKIKDLLFGLNKLKLEDNKYISYDIIVGENSFQSNLINKIKEIISDGENLMEFIEPIIQMIRKLSDENTGKTAKFTEFLDFITYYNFEGCKNCLEDIIKKIKKINNKIEIEINLSILISKSNKELNQEKIEAMIQEMIECGAIDLKEGIFTKNFILDNDYIQSFKFKIDNKFKKLKFDINKKISNETLEFFNSFKIGFSEKALNNELKK